MPTTPTPDGFHFLAVVFDLESTPPMPLGLYTETVEDSVAYLDPSSAIRHAPADCVRVVMVDLSPEANASRRAALNG